MQFIMGVLLMNTEFGFTLFKFMGERIITFLDFTDKGAELVFGPNFRDHFFAFKVR